MSYIFGKLRHSGSQTLPLLFYSIKIWCHGCHPKLVTFPYFVNFTQYWIYHVLPVEKYCKLFIRIYPKTCETCHILHLFCLTISPGCWTTKESINSCLWKSCELRLLKWVEFFKLLSLGFFVFSFFGWTDLQRCWPCFCLCLVFLLPGVSPSCLSLLLLF